MVESDKQCVPIPEPTPISGQGAEVPTEINEWMTQELPARTWFHIELQPKGGKRKEIVPLLSGFQVNTKWTTVVV
jgi:hypothetical protein